MKKSELRELIREQVRNLIKEASVSQEAYTIHNITKCGQDAAQNFIDDNKLDGKKLAAYVRQHSNSKEKYDVRDIIAGTGVGANVGFKSRFLKQFKESVIKEAKEYTFTFDYNTDPDDIEYIENLLKKARVNAYAEQGTFDDEMVVIAGDAIELRKAKKAIEDDGFQINEASLTEANEMSFINKARAKSSLEQIKKGKRSDGMGKFDAKVYAIKGTQEIELTDPSDLAKYSVGYKYGLKSESVLKEADMTKFYDGFIVLDFKNKKTYKFKYIKGSNNVNVENIAIAKLVKATGLSQANFTVHGFVRKGQWDMDKTPIFTESVLKEALIGPFAISNSTPDDELIAMYHGALDGFSNYKTGMKFKKSEYKLAYQTIEKILQKKGVAITEADDPEAGEAAPYGSGYSEVNEDAGMVIDVAMGVAAGLMGLWALVQSAPLVGRLFGDSAEHLANKFEKQAKMALKNHRKETIAPILAKFKNDTRLADMYQKLTPYTQGLNKNQILDNKDRKRQLITIGNYIKSKLTPEEMRYFTDVSAMLRDGDLRESVLTESQIKASVLSVGIINMTNGKTAHGWSIFDSKLTAYLTSGNYLLLAAPGTFKVNDSVDLIGNDTNRRLSKNHTIVGESPTDKDELLKFLKSNGFDYYPLRAFKSRPAGNKKLQTSYSVKGTQ
jgi:hypothetical protein